jgi:hypothetical protein
MRTLPTFDPQDGDAPVRPETFIPAPDGLQAVFAEDPSYGDDALTTVESCSIRVAKVLGWLVYRDPGADPTQESMDEQLRSILVVLGYRGLEFGDQQYADIDVETEMECPEIAFLGFAQSGDAGHDWEAAGRKALAPRKAHGRRLEKAKRQAAAWAKQAAAKVAG